MKRIMKSDKPKRIMFAGASGTGKTTLANFISQVYGEGQIPFLSGSVSDLLPETKSMPHKDMLARDSQTLEMEDFQILNLRKKLFQDKVNKDESFVSDRSFLDSAAYFLYKQADKLPQCEVETFLDLCLMCLNTQCTHLFIVPYNMTMFKHWITEDNNKRILSRYFQMEISTIMEMILKIWGFRKDGTIRSTSKGFFCSTEYEAGISYGEISTPYGTTKVFILDEVNLNNREALISYVLDK